MMADPGNTMWPIAEHRLRTERPPSISDAGPYHHLSALMPQSHSLVQTALAVTAQKYKLRPPHTNYRIDIFITTLSTEARFLVFW